MARRGLGNPMLGWLPMPHQTGDLPSYFWSVPDPERVALVEQELAEEGLPGPNYMFLVFASCIIATLGLLANSTAVIIGAMIVAPLMLPIRALAFGVLRGDPHRVEVAGIALGLGVAVAISLSALLGWLVGLPEFGSEVAARTSPNLLDLGVALAAGAVSGQAKLKPTISDAVAGTAIAVALMPPLCTVGLSLSVGHGAGAWGAFLLFLTNLLGIALACMLSFVWGGMAAGRKRTRRALGWTTALTALVVLPLGYSSFQLVNQARTAALAKHLLLTGTATFGNRMELLESRVDWASKAPELHLTVRTPDLPSPKQVGLLEAFLAQRTGQHFRLVFEVSRLDVVRAEASPQAEPKVHGAPSLPVQPKPIASPQGQSLPALDPAASTVPAEADGKGSQSLQP